MSLDAKKKRMLAFGGIALVLVVGIGWALTSSGSSPTVRATDRRVADDSIDNDDLVSQDDVAVRSAPQSRSGRSRLEGTSATAPARDDKLVDGVEKKTKRNKKPKRRKSRKQEDDEEEAATAANKKIHPPYGK